MAVQIKTHILITYALYDCLHDFPQAGTRRYGTYEGVMLARSGRCLILDMLSGKDAQCRDGPHS